MELDFILSLITSDSALLSLSAGTCSELIMSKYNFVLIIFQTEPFSLGVDIFWGGRGMEKKKSLLS